jgi:hypothetical protein
MFVAYVGILDGAGRSSFVVVLVASWLHYTPGLWWKTMMETRDANCLLTFPFVPSLVPFSFSFLISAVHHAIPALHQGPAKSRPSPPLYRDNGDEDMFTYLHI